MGMDFCALLNCDVSGAACQNAVTLLEQGSPDAVQRIADHWHRSGFASLSCGKAAWVPRYSAEPGVSIRPSLPNLKLALRTDEAFFLTFGANAVCIYHILRWRRFLTDKEWQSTMLDVCNAFADLFASPVGIVTRDESPVIEAFFHSSTFADSLAAGEDKDGEVDQLDDLFEVVDSDGTWDSHGFYRFRSKDRQVAHGTRAFRRGSRHSLD